MVIDVEPLRRNAFVMTTQGRIVTTLTLKRADVEAFMDALESVFPENFDSETNDRMDALMSRLAKAHQRLEDQ